MELQHNKHTRFPFYVPSPGERGQADKCPLFSLIPYQFFIFQSRSLFSLFFNLCISFHLFTYVLFFWLYFKSEDTKQIQFSLEFSLCEKYSYWRKYTNLLRIIIRVFHHTVQGINEERFTNIFKNLWQNNKDFFLMKNGNWLCNLWVWKAQLVFS